MTTWRFVALLSTFVIGWVWGLPVARADIYMWTDGSGTIHLSNLTPPDGVSVTKVYHEDPAANERAEAARRAVRDAEIQALSERVQQLERELDVGAPRVAAAAPYTSVPVAVPVPIPVPVPYATAYMPPAQPYPEPVASTQTYTCGASLWNCDGLVNPWYYAPAIAVVAAPLAYGYRGVNRPSRFAGHPGHPGHPVQSGRPGIVGNPMGPTLTLSAPRRG